MTDEQITTLLKTLKQRTIEKALIWKKGSSDIFQISFPNSSITIRKFQSDEYSQPKFSLYILNNRGETVLVVDEENLYCYLSDEAHSFLDDLYKMVSDQYYKVDDTIEDILSNLDACDLL